MGNNTPQTARNSQLNDAEELIIEEQHKRSETY